METNDDSILKEAVYILSNITAGTVSQIQKVCNSNILYKLMDIINTRLGANINTFYDEFIIKDCYFCLLNSVTGGLIEIKTYLMDYKICFLDMLINGLVYYTTKKESNNLRLVNEILVVMKQFIWYEKEMLIDDDVIAYKFKNSPGVIEILEDLSLTGMNETIVTSANQLLEVIEGFKDKDIKDIASNINILHDVEMNDNTEDDDFRYNLN